MSLILKLQAYTNEVTQKGLLRTRQVHDPSKLCFDSNDYLSLAHHPEIKKAYQEGHCSLPVGSSGSTYLNGYHASHLALESSFATWLSVDNCLLFSSGYAANLAVMSLLGTLRLQALIDKGLHASIYDGLKLSRVSYKRFLHNDYLDAKKQLSCFKDASVLITEGIFSMSGQTAHLSHYAPLCAEHKMALIVDEAHSIGLLGDEGRGAVAHHGLTQREVPLRVLPLGKAFASSGALVAGESTWILALLQSARSLIYSTGLSPAVSYGLLKTLDFVVKADQRRARLYDLIEYFRAQIKNSPLRWTDSSSPIQQVQLGCPHLASMYAEALKKQGISCSAIRQPTVSKKASGLRILLNYQHTSEQIDRLFKQLALIYEASSH